MFNDNSIKAKKCYDDVCRLLVEYYVTTLNDIKVRLQKRVIDISQGDVWFWKLFNIPVYLFVMNYEDDSIAGCYYKRLTPKLTILKDKPVTDIIQAIHEEPFYSIDQSGLYRESDKFYGFYRDLRIDSIRCLYSMGAIYIDRDSSKFVYLDLLNDYAEVIHETVSSISSLRYLFQKNDKLQISYSRLWENIQKL